MCNASVDLRTFAELRGAGQSRRAIAAGVRAGRLSPIRRGVYSSAAACPPAITAAAHGGALACVSAARHLGLWVLDVTETVHVALGSHGRSLPHSECTCVSHWDDAHSDDDRAADSFGLPRVSRVLRQILGCRGLEEFFVALESALHLRKITAAEMTWLRAHTNADARDAIGYAGKDAESGLESLLRWRLRHRGLTIRSQVRIASVGVVDFVIGERLIIEVDGRENHESAGHRHKDLLRDAHSAVWGYVTLRFDYAMVVHDWETVELAILAQVDQGRHLAHSRW